MKTQMWAWLVILLLCGAVAATAAGIDGKWLAQVPGRDGGTMEFTFTFKADGETLTGAMSTQMGEREISEGKISGSDISFVVQLSFQGNDMKLLYKGKLSGDELQLTSQREGSDRVREFTAKRSGS